MIRLAILLALMGSTAAAETRYLCWRGNGGYTMTGRFTFPDSLATADLVTGAQVEEFEIEGFLDGEPVGRWSLADRTAQTSWLLRYSPVQGRFLVGDLDDGLYQMWNGSGDVDDCGTPGFGFNAGNAGQDVCIDDTYIWQSTIDPLTPLLTYNAPRDPRTCSNEPLLGKR